VLADLFITPAILAVIVGILSWNARAGLIVGALLLCAELAVLAYPPHERPQHCELIDSCRAVAPSARAALSSPSAITGPTGSPMPTTQSKLTGLAAARSGQHCVDLFAADACRARGAGWYPLRIYRAAVGEPPPVHPVPGEPHPGPDKRP
jgi:hypothetical protein